MSITGVLAFAIAVAVPASADAADSPAQQTQREVIPGADRMSAAEREIYRRRIEAAATAEEKSRIRAEYVNAAHAKMPEAVLAGDPAKGATAHRGCFGCHGVERYTASVTSAVASFLDSLLRASGLSDMPPADSTRAKGRIATLAQLREAVARRNDYLNPKMTPQEFEDVIAYLNATYYKFPQ